MDKYQKKRITILLIILSLVLIMALAAYLIFISNIFTNNSDKESAKIKECGALISVDGKIEGV